MRSDYRLSVIAALCVALLIPQAIAQPTTNSENLIPVPQVAPVMPTSIIKAAVPNHPRQVLKNGKHFLVMDEAGMMPVDSNIGCGLYRDDTRYLSQWEIMLDDRPLTLLSATTSPGYSGRFIYGNKASRHTHEDRHVPEQSIVVQRDIVITDAAREHLELTNFGSKQVDVTLAIKYGADFADMFEIRGYPRKQRGEFAGSVIDNSNTQVTLTYKGLDQKLMKTMIAFRHQKPAQLQENLAEFKLTLKPKQTEILESAVGTNFDEPLAQLMDDDSISVPQRKFGFTAELNKADADYRNWCAQGATISTDNADMNRLLDRSLHDLYILRQPTPKGECLAAGIPWFSVAFGRDQVIAGKETLPIAPQLSKDILTVLAAYQGTKNDDYTSERPGKIMHELRLGEMARLREIPFIPYYGSVDATPLWLCLLSDYVDWTGDLDLAKKLWPNVEQALQFLDADMDKSRYLTYGKRTGEALVNQGWKDSADSVMYASGELAKPPIALAEVQAYLYDAWKRTSRLATSLGHKDLADTLATKASALQKRYQEDFWEPDKRYLCIALDGEGKQCTASSSNPGHALATGILTDEQNGYVADKLLFPEMFSGWGIRTLSANERAFNPISYHNGSIWPHDNAMIVQGLCAIGRKKDAGTVSGAIFDAAVNQAEYRLPELYCGFSRAYSNRPIWYPVSCSPQAWAAGSMFLMLDSMLGLKADALNNKLYVVKPMLPPWLNRLTMRGLNVGKSKVDLRFVRLDNNVQCEVVNKIGSLSVIVQ